jgi:hypothetical protein
VPKLPKSTRHKQAIFNEGSLQRGKNCLPKSPSNIEHVSCLFTIVYDISCLFTFFAGCCGRSEDNTSWGLIIGTVVFSIVYNFSRFFEYQVEWVTDMMPYSNQTGEWLEEYINSSDVNLVNRTFMIVAQTGLRSNVTYIQYYILVTNFIFMGIIPSIIMISFNVLVVRAVNEANQRRARMTRRQQRNITVTSMLVSKHNFGSIVVGWIVVSEASSAINLLYLHKYTQCKVMQRR